MEYLFLIFTSSTWAFVEVIKQVLIYWGILGCKMSQNKIRWILAAFLLTFGSFCTIYFPYIIFYFKAEEFVYLGFLILIFSGSIRKKIFWFLPIVVMINAFDQLLFSTLSFSEGISIETIFYSSNWEYIRYNSFSIIPLFFLSIVVKKKKPNINKVKIPTWLYGMILGLSICSSIIQRGISGLIYYNKKNYSVLIYLSGALITILLATFIGVAYSLLHSSKYYKQLLDINTYWARMQMEYYNEMNERDQELRRFRHDCNAHLECMKQLAAAKEYEALGEHIENLNMISENFFFSVKTGHVVVDAIINDIAGKAARDGIRFLCVGRLPKNLKMDIVDVVSILYNALENSLEECKKGKVNDNRYINVEFLRNKGKLYISIVNPIFSRLKMEKGILVTTKMDTKAHGFGVRNIKRTVEKYSGKVEWKIKKNIMELAIEFEYVLEEESEYEDSNL